MLDNIEKHLKKFEAFKTLVLTFLAQCIPYHFQYISTLDESGNLSALTSHISCDEVLASIGEHYRPLS